MIGRQRKVLARRKHPAKNNQNDQLSLCRELDTSGVILVHAVSGLRIRIWSDTQTSWVLRPARTYRRRPEIMANPQGGECLW
jgi:hypothetical protein